MVALDLAVLLDDENFVLSPTANVVLLSLSHIIIRQSENDYKLDLKKFYTTHGVANPCPVYDIEINSHRNNWLITMDSIEQLDSSTEVHGFEKARAVVTTPLPNVMKVNTTNSKWKERSDVDSRQIDATLTVDEKAAREYQAKNKWSMGSRIIPQNTWFYGDSALSCSQRTYENVALHYGQCPIGVTQSISNEGEKQRYGLDECDGSWLAKSDSYVLENSGDSIIPMAFMQMTHYEAQLAGGSTSEQTGLKFTSIDSKQWGKFQKFTEERKRRDGDPDWKGNKPEQKRGSVMVATKVGKPFIPNFDLIFSEMDEDECPILKSTKPITGGYTIVVQGKDELNNFKVGSAYQYTFDAKMARCSSKPQNYHTMLEAAADDSVNVWSRDNFVDCDKVSDTNHADHDYTSYASEPYPILGNHTLMTKNEFKSATQDIIKRIKKHLPYSYWDPDGQFRSWYSNPEQIRNEANASLWKESCYVNSGK